MVWQFQHELACQKISVPVPLSAHAKRGHDLRMGFFKYDLRKRFTAKDPVP
jgi:hypothetical protein